MGLSPFVRAAAGDPLVRRQVAKRGARAAARAKLSTGNSTVKAKLAEGNAQLAANKASVADSAQRTNLQIKGGVTKLRLHQALLNASKPKPHGGMHPDVGSKLGR